MIRFHVITIYPSFIETYSQLGTLNRAQIAKKIEVTPVNLRTFAADQRGSVDDRPFGGGDGMVLRADCLSRAIKSLNLTSPLILLPSPAGELWTQHHAKELSCYEGDIVLVCGRFGGVDQRFIDAYVSRSFSVGHYVLSGGELPALAIIESISRLIPGVLGNDESAQVDSFSGRLENAIEHPLYTRPVDFEGMKVPAELVSGNHELIKNWRRQREREISPRSPVMK